MWFSETGLTRFSTPVERPRQQDRAQDCVATIAQQLFVSVKTGSPTGSDTFNDSNQVLLQVESTPASSCQVRGQQHNMPCVQVLTLMLLLSL